MSEQHQTSEPVQAISYGFGCELNERDFDTAIARVTEALKAEGFVMDPMAIMQMTGNAEVAKVAQEVNERLQRVMTALSASPAKPQS